MSESEIINFFTNQTVFLTGGTGFLGKVLVEKFLRVCQIKTLYLLVRPKKDKSVEERFDDFFNYPCFQNLKTSEFKEKIVFVHGDCEKPNLGLSEETQNILIKETEVVIHAAANVKFDLPLRSAANINVGSTRDILNLAKKMQNLKSFVYVSTAFSNCPNKTIDEKCYPPPMTPEQLFSLLDGVPEDVILDGITPTILKEWPNTYTFTKSIAEHFLSQEGKGLPICISRPAIVFSTIQEPVPGWVDNFYGVTGLTLAACLGVLRSLHAKLDAKMQLVPCDYVCNSILAATWNTAMQKSKNIIFYNVGHTEKNSMVWREYINLIETYAWRYPTEKLVWHYCFKVRENKTWHKICTFFLHTVLAYIADFVLICIGRKPLAVENYARLDNLLTLTEYFGAGDWIFVTDNTRKLWEKMSFKDKQLFMFNMDEISWPSYINESIKYGRIYLLKDPLETIPQGQKKMDILKVAHYTMLALLYLLLFFIVKWMLF